MVSGLIRFTNSIWKMMYMKTICMANLIYLGITYLIWPMTVQYGTSPKQYLKFVSYNWLIISLSLSLSLSFSLYFSSTFIFSILIFNVSCTLDLKMHLFSYKEWWPLSLFSYSWVHERSDSCLICKLTCVYSFPYEWE